MLKPPKHHFNHKPVAPSSLKNTVTASKEKEVQWYPFLLRRQFAPLIAQHPGDLRERHLGPLGSQLLPALVHEPHVPGQGGFGGIAVPQGLLPLPPFGPASSFGSLLLQNEKDDNSD